MRFAGGTPEMGKIWSQKYQVVLAVEFGTVSDKANARATKDQRQLKFGMEMPGSGKPRLEDLSNEKAMLLFLGNRFKQRFHALEGEQNPITSRQQCRRKMRP